MRGTNGPVRGTEGPVTETGPLLIARKPFNCTRFASCFSPYRAPEAPGAEIREKWGKITKFPSPLQPPKMGEKLPKNYKKMYFRSIFCNFWVIFPHFRGLDRGAEFCNFSPFFGDFRPGGFRGSVRGKTTRNTRSSDGCRTKHIHRDGHLNSTECLSRSMGLKDPMDLQNL